MKVVALIIIALVTIRGPLLNVFSVIWGRSGKGDEKEA